MRETILKCDRCKCKVSKLVIVPNPSLCNGVYYAKEVPYAVYPRNWELCEACTGYLINVIRDFCDGKFEYLGES